MTTTPKDYPNDPKIDSSKIPDIQSIEELLNTVELANLLRVSSGLINTWRSKYGLPFVRMGKFAIFSKTQVVYWLNWYQRNIPDRVGIHGRMIVMMTERNKKR